MGENKIEVNQSRIMARNINKRATKKIKNDREEIRWWKRNLDKGYKKYIKKIGKEKKNASRIEEASTKMKKGLRIFASTNEIDNYELREYAKECVKALITKVMIEKDIIDQAAANATKTKKPRANKKTAKNMDENP
jgi:hypothetical protein